MAVAFERSKAAEQGLGTRLSTDSVNGYTEWLPVSACSKQESCCLLEHDGVIQWGVVESVPHVDRRPVLQEVADGLQVTLTAGKMEGRAAIIVRDTEVVVTSLHRVEREWI